MFHFNLFRVANNPFPYARCHCGGEARGKDGRKSPSSNSFSAIAEKCIYGAGKDARV